MNSRLLELAWHGASRLLLKCAPLILCAALGGTGCVANTDVKTASKEVSLTIDAMQASRKDFDLTAKRAALLQEKFGDFSDIVDPATVQELVDLSIQVHHAAEQKKQAAAIIGLVEQVIKKAADVAGAVAAA